MQTVTKKINPQIELRRMRELAKMTQEDFALSIGIPYRTYQDWERGVRKPSMAALKLIEILAQNDKIWRSKK